MKKQLKRNFNTGFKWIKIGNFTKHAVEEFEKTLVNDKSNID